MELSETERDIILEALRARHAAELCEAMRIEHFLSYETDGRKTENKFSRECRGRSAAIYALIERFEDA